MFCENDNRPLTLGYNKAVCYDVTLLLTFQLYLRITYKLYNKGTELFYVVMCLYANGPINQDLVYIYCIQ